MQIRKVQKRSIYQAKILEKGKINFRIHSQTEFQNQKKTAISTWIRKKECKTFKMKEKRLFSSPSLSFTKSRCSTFNVEQNRDRFVYLCARTQSNKPKNCTCSSFSSSGRSGRGGSRLFCFSSPLVFLGAFSYRFSFKTTAKSGLDTTNETNKIVQIESGNIYLKSAAASASGSAQSDSLLRRRSSSFVEVSILYSPSNDWPRWADERERGDNRLQTVK